jgi:hypothetical protein
MESVNTPFPTVPVLSRVDSSSWEHVCLRRRYSVTAGYIYLVRICCLAAGVVSLFRGRCLATGLYMLQYVCMYVLYMYNEILNDGYEAN